MVNNRYFNKPYTYLFDYQIKKIASNRDAEIIFIGDSSLGNCLDASLFTQLTNQKTLNLALFGHYGFYGASLILSNLFSKENRVHTVVVMFSIDQFSRDLPFSKLKENEFDLENMILFSSQNVRKVLFEYMNAGEFLRGWDRLILSKNKADYFFDDYIKQAATNAVIDSTFHFEVKDMKNEKLIFLKKIKRLCDENKVRLIYMHAPTLNTIAIQSKGYLEEINKILASLKIRTIRKILMVPKSDIGDSMNHVKVEKKRAYTERIYEIMTREL